MPTFDLPGLAWLREYLRPTIPAAMPPKANFSAPTITGKTDKPVINLLRGWPNRALLPVDLIKEAAAAALSDPSVAHPGLEYGPDAGNQAFRDAVALWLTSFYRPPKPISSERICINGGASQSLGNIVSVYTDPEYTRNIWLVSPTYMLAFGIFQDAGFNGKLRAVPEDEEGIDTGYLRREIAKSEEKAKSRGNNSPRYKTGKEGAKVYKHVVYCVPTFSNPSSRTMTKDRRIELVRLAREFDALVVCDDVYDVLQFPANPSAQPVLTESSHMPRLVSVDDSLDGGVSRPDADGFGNVCSNGTFSKIAGPGLRCGWIEASEKFAYGVSQAGIQRSGGAPCQLTSTYITHMLVEGQIQKHINEVLRPAYATRYTTMAQAIKKHLLPLGYRMPQPDRDIVGGYFVWLGLPEGLDATKLAQKCQEEEYLVIAPGTIFEVPGDDSLKYPAEVRLCFAYEDLAKLREGIERIARVSRKLLLLTQDEHEADYVVVEDGDESRDKLQDFM